MSKRDPNEAQDAYIFKCLVEGSFKAYSYHQAVAQASSRQITLCLAKIKKAKGELWETKVSDLEMQLRARAQRDASEKQSAGDGKATTASMSARVIDTPPAPGSSSSMKTKTPSTAIVPAQDKQFQEMGQQLTVQYHRAVQGYRDLVILGAMVAKIQECLSTCGHAKLGNDERKGGGLKGWLEKYAPEVPRARAYEFLKIAEGIKETFQLGARTDLATLLQTPKPEKLPDAQRKKLEAILEAISGKSRRQLLLNFGGIGVPDDDKKPQGGHHPGKKLTPEEQEARVKKMAKEEWELSLQTIDDFLTQGRHLVVTKDMRRQMIDCLKIAIEKLEKVAD